MGRERQDASETFQPYSFDGQIAMKYGLKGGAGEIAAQVCQREQNQVLRAVSMKQWNPSSQKKARDKAALAAVAKEMQRPRFVESARAEEEAADHPATNRKK